MSKLAYVFFYVVSQLPENFLSETRDRKEASEGEGTNKIVKADSFSNEAKMHTKNFLDEGGNSVDQKHLNHRVDQVGKKNYDALFVSSITGEKLREKHTLKAVIVVKVKHKNNFFKQKNRTTFLVALTAVLNADFLRAQQS